MFLYQVLLSLSLLDSLLSPLLITNFVVESMCCSSGSDNSSSSSSSIVEEMVLVV